MSGHPTLTEIYALPDPMDQAIERWHVRCSCGWDDLGYVQSDEARTAALMHRWARHVDETLRAVHPESAQADVWPIDSSEQESEG